MERRAERRAERRISGEENQWRGEQRGEQTDDMDLIMLHAGRSHTIRLETLHRPALATASTTAHFLMYITSP